MRTVVAEMKKKSERISRIVAVSKTEERSQCQEMGRAQKKLDDEVDRLGELKAYRHSYQRQFQPGGDVSSARWQDYQNFMRRLDQAVLAQQEQVLTGRQNRDAHRQRWMVKKQKLESLERIVDRYRRSEDVELERQLQKTLDDLPAKTDIYEQD